MVAAAEATLEVSEETEMVQTRPEEEESEVVELEEEVELEEATGVRQVSVTVPMALL